MKSDFGCLAYFILIVGIIAAIISLEVYVFMLLWNWLIPLFWVSAPILTFWQTFGLIFLIGIIIGLIGSISKSI